MARATGDEVAVLESAYWLDGTETEWLSGLAHAAQPLLDVGLGITASIWKPPHTLQTIAAIGGPPGFADAVTHALSGACSELKLAIFSAQPVTSLVSSGAAQHVTTDTASAGLLELGVRDSISIFGGHAPGDVVNLQVYLPRAVQISRHFALRWSRIASHFAAALRVRRGLSEARLSGVVRADPVLGSEAILTPDGKLVHAEDPAKSAQTILAHAVVAMDRARSKEHRADPDAALELWRGLVAGRWSLIEYFDSDGKRLLVARKNDPSRPGPPGLLARERHVLLARARGLSLKLIGYDLGLSLSTVSRILSAGMAKLGVCHEAELAGFFPVVEDVCGPSLELRRP